MMRVVAPILALAVAAGTAFAQPAPTDADLATAKQEDDRPWAKGVSREQQLAALALFNEANALLRDALFPKAADKYRAALEHWDHPAIHYNLALALVNLDQPVEMYDALDKAMAFGPAPLDPDKFERARSYKLLVEKQLALVELSIGVPDAVVVFDGKVVLKGKGTWSSRVRSGEHSVVARAPGYSPTQLNQRIGGGEVSRLDLKLFTDAELTRFKRRYPTWVPWTVAGAGAAIVGVGGILHVTARSRFAAYDDAIRDCARTDPSGGCAMPGSSVFDKKSSAETMQSLAITAYAVGGLAIAGGVVLIILNQPESYRIDPFVRADGGGGVSASGRF